MTLGGVRAAGAAWVALVLVAGLVPARAGDPAAAERQYRIARRLAAERSPEAAQALRKVVELDPSGPLADDAIVDQALLEGLPRWPEDLGNLSRDAAKRALALLDRVAGEFANADRISEARYYRALLRLEPLPTYDATEARLDLITVATNPETSEWTRAARYAGAWLASTIGRLDRAGSAYARLTIDEPLAPAAARAAIGLARLQLHEGRSGDAAWRLDEALQREVDPRLGARALLDLAVRRVVEQAEGSGTPELATVVVSTGVRSAVSMARAPRGIVVCDGRDGTVRLIDPEHGEERWTLGNCHAVAVDPFGRIYAATEDGIHRLRPGAPPEALASTGVYAPPGGLAAASDGTLWLVDRKGESLGRIAPGASEPVEAWKVQGARLTALRWDGFRLVAVDAKARDVVVFEADGGPRSLGLQGLSKPVALAVDAAGRVAVLDAKEDTIVAFDPSGAPLFRFPCKAGGIAKPVDIDLALDGTLDVFDDATEGWYALR